MRALFLISSILFLASCSDSILDNNTTDSSNTTANEEWLVSKAKVIDGGPGKDGIPALLDPNFIDASDANYLNFEELIVGIKIGDEVKAYPHSILNWHEIVNDDINNTKFALSYCPLTGTAFSWNRSIQNQTTTFGVSGLLYNSNLILYDRRTNSNWSQMRQQSINGELINLTPNNFTVVETIWGVWKNMYPETKVLSTNTGFDKDYNDYPYGDFKTSTNILFPVCATNNFYHPKKRIHAVVLNNTAKVYSSDSFISDGFLIDTFQDKSILVVGNSTFINSFILTNSFNSLEFEYIYNNSEAILRDNENNQWNIFGEAISGPRLGQKLERTNSFMSYWFAIESFYPNPEIY